jgi:hypothetical protein
MHCIPCNRDTSSPPPIPPPIPPPFRRTRSRTPHRPRSDRARRTTSMHPPTSSRSNSDCSSWRRTRSMWRWGRRHRRARRRGRRMRFGRRGGTTTAIISEGGGTVPVDVDCHPRDDDDDGDDLYSRDIGRDHFAVAGVVDVGRRRRRFRGRMASPFLLRYLIYILSDTNEWVYVNMNLCDRA